jgi:hypothetical protein
LEHAALNPICGLLPKNIEIWTPLSDKHMTADKAFISTTDLTERIKEKTRGMETGKTSLAALDDLLDDIRELEERIIVIRYKGMERLRMEDFPAVVQEPIVTVPEPIKRIEPNEPIMEEEKELPEIPQVKEPEVVISAASTNQISLIDSIEEISKVMVEDNVNDNSKEKGKSNEDVGVTELIAAVKSEEDKVVVEPKKVKAKEPALVNERNAEKANMSYAEKMEQRPVLNIKKELNLNQRLGLGRVLAPGDDKGLDRILAQVDEAENMDQALSLIKSAASNRWDNSPELMDQLINIVERKFQ